MSFDNSFFRWYASHHARGQAKAVPFKGGLDLIMDTYASARFSLGLDEDQVAALGVPPEECEALKRCKWADIAFLRRLRGGDWVVLRTMDIRTDEPSSGAALAARIWLPIMPGLLHEWAGDVPRPTSLRLCTTLIERGKALRDGSKPWAEAPLVYKGEGFDGGNSYEQTRIMLDGAELGRATVMLPLYGMSVLGQPADEASCNEMEMALDDAPMLREAMERLITPDVAPDPGLDSIPGPQPTLDATPSPQGPTPFRR